MLGSLLAVITSYSTALLKTLFEGLFNLPVGVQKSTRLYIYTYHYIRDTLIQIMNRSLHTVYVKYIPR